MCMSLTFPIKSYFLILYTAAPIISSLQATARGQMRCFGFLMCVFHLWMETPLVRKSMEMPNSNKWIAKRYNNCLLLLFINYFIKYIFFLQLSHHHHYAARPEPCFWHYITPHLSPRFSFSSPFISFFILPRALSILLCYHFPCPAPISPGAKLTP